MQRVIREVEPPRPSSRLTAQLETVASVAAQRQAAPHLLERQLRGELDWIVMKCLEKSPSRRYSAASGRIADISRYRQDEPVTARPAASTWYQISKAVRRHRGAFVAGSAVAVALLLGIIG